MREKAREIFGGKKCRSRSLDFTFTADYLELRNSDIVMNALTTKTYTDKKILFDDSVTKFNLKLKDQERVLLLSENAIYNVKPPLTKRCKVQRRIPIQDVSRISMSTYGDNFIAIHIKEGAEDFKRGDTLLSMTRKTEFVATLMDAAAALNHTIDLHFDDRIRARLYQNELEVQVVEDASLPPREEQLSLMSKVLLKVSVGAELGSRAPVGKQ
eukprot:CAMPEP_0195511310 /NCGR_PEP_ID=MMETSP0794_2-20130614/3674_1 /TAXON_ID=515487 /ORGANISM="Stephanopyxis turris, Strain CCMP 815" /LENGTH=212 /DNA_ID=CAMNT_0040638879 /DNA_START=15 /DNA_END=653 /DNA_ORIENTATION=-